MSDIKIRRARPTDSSAIAACIDVAYAPVLARGLDLPPVSEGVLDDIHDNTVWVALDGPETLAGLIITIHNQVLHIANLFVSPAAQGRGLARDLMRVATDHAEDQGCNEMRLATHKDMPENVALYEHLGWMKYASEGNKIMMSKPVSSG